MVEGPEFVGSCNSPFPSIPAAWTLPELLTWFLDLIPFCEIDNNRKNRTSDCRKPPGADEKMSGGLVSLIPFEEVGKPSISSY